MLKYTFLYTRFITIVNGYLLYTPNGFPYIHYYILCGHLIYTDYNYVYDTVNFMLDTF